METLCSQTWNWMVRSAILMCLFQNSNSSLKSMDGTRLLPEQIKNLGSFRIEIGRIQRTPREQPLTIPYSTYKPITSVSEKLIKGKSIRNITR